MEEPVESSRWPPPMSWTDSPVRLRWLTNSSSLCEGPDASLWRPWDSDQDDLNQCFEDVTLPLLSVVLLLALSPWVCKTALSASPTLRGQPPNRIDALRQSFIILCGLLPLTFLVGSLSVGSLALLREQQVSLALSLLFYAAFFLLQSFGARRGCKQHLLLRMALTLQFLAQAVKVQSTIRRWQRAQSSAWAAVSPADVEAALMLLPQFALWVAFCVFNSRSEPVLGDAASMGPRVHSSPEARASFFGLLTFSWMRPLISKGHTQQLVAADAYELMPQDTTETQTETVLAAWAALEAEAVASSSQQQQQQQQQTSPSFYTSSTHASDSAASLLSPEDRQHSSSSNGSNSNGSSSRRKEVKLFRVLWRAYGSFLLGSAAYKLVYDFLQVVGPMVLQQIILFLQRSADKTREPPPVQEGLVCCVVLLLSNATQTAVLHQYFHRQFRLGMRIRVAVSSLIYRKALKIQTGAVASAFETDPNNPNNNNSGSSSSASSSSSSGGAAGRTTGQYVNLLAVDAQRLEDLMAYAHILWSAPLQICVALTLLFRLLGLAAFGGLAVMLLNGPLTGFIGRQATRMQRRLMVIRDERSSAVTELLAGIKAVKMYAWENSFFTLITAVRERELKTLKVYWRLMVASRTQWLGTPLCVSVATFGCYVLLHGDIDAATAFTAIALFDVLRFPMQLLPMTTNNTLEARVALKRIQTFLNQEEAEGLPALPGNTDKRNRAAFTHFKSTTTTRPPPSSACSVESEGEVEGSADGGDSLPAIEVEHASFAWPNGAPLLKDISFQCKKGELVAIVGATGAGKSGLLLSLLGSTVRVASRRGAPRRQPQEGGPLLNPIEADPSRASKVVLRGSVAYCSQVPWIQSATLKENVLFGAEMDEDWYYRVLEACALLPDIESLPGGDETEIGERGINLSGGQKQRVALARAVYRRADTYLLDDCLSAVDVHVSQHVFERCLKGLLKHKAVLLVSHRLAVLPGCDRILFISKGTQRVFGTLQEARSISEFNLFAATSEKSEEQGEEQDASYNASWGVQTPQQGKEAQAAAKAWANAASPGQRRAVGSLTDEEGVQTGAVPFAVYAEYMRATGGWTHVVLSVMMLFGGSLLLALSNVWLSAWVDKKVSTSRRLSLCIFVSLGLAHLLTSVAAYLKVSFGSVAAARYYHQRLLRSILDAPMSFFDMTPSGRLMNRLTKSIYGIDEALPSALLSYVTMFVACLMTVCVITFVFPSFLIVVVPLLYYYITIQGFYIPTSRQLKRIEAVLRSPIFSHFQETIEGTETIRAFREEGRFIDISTKKLNENTRVYYMSIAANRWLAVRLETVGAAVVVSSSLLCVLARGLISGGLGGLAVSYALSVTQQLNWLVRMASDRETNIVAVERVQDYSEGVPPERLEPTPTPAAAAAAGAAAAASADWRNWIPKGWPGRGAISVKRLCVRYRPDLPLVLKSISFDVRPGEKVGLVGRTGAGKSSLLVSLLRLVEPTSGSIEIDGVDLQSVGLRFLRSRFSIIPQDPVLFAGSLRFNIDAQGEHTDAQIWEALEGAHLAEALRAMTARVRRGSASSTSSSNRSRASSEALRFEALGSGESLAAAMLPAAAAADDDVGFQVAAGGLNPLDMLVEEGGRNFSLGQRQLICLARALLRRSRILLLDEATAVVDPRTDRLIQETIKTDFKECTVITIAHRIDTIVNYDRVLVLSEGRIEEFDSPRVLYLRKDSFFRSLCVQAGVQPDKV